MGAKTGPSAGHRFPPELALEAGFRPCGELGGYQWAWLDDWLSAKICGNKVCHFGFQ
jgi:hypothetical protein